VGQHSGSPWRAKSRSHLPARPQVASRAMPVPSFHPRTPGARRLEGRRALVTGADSGIGQGIAYELAAHGAAVAINHVGDGAIAQAMAAEIERGGGRAIAVQMDVSREDDVGRAFGEARDAFGGLDLLVNNAGIEKP